MLGQKLGHQAKSYKNLMYSLEATVSVQYSCKLVTMFNLMIAPMIWEMGHVRSKTRSPHRKLGQIIEEPMVVIKGL